MKNKVLVELYIPAIDKVYNVYLPANRKIGNIITLINKALLDFTNGNYGNSKYNFFYNSLGDKYPVNVLLKDTDIRNGSRVVLF